MSTPVCSCNFGSVKISQLHRNTKNFDQKLRCQMYDLSGCFAMLPGQFCFVGCFAPYATGSETTGNHFGVGWEFWQKIDVGCPLSTDEVLIGQTTFASCPSTNTDPNKDMDWHGFPMSDLEMQEFGILCRARLGTNKAL